MMYGAFRRMVTDFLNRKEITPAQVDIFVNLAKLRLQRDMNLELAVKRKTYTYPTLGGGVELDSDFKALIGEFSVVILNAAGGRTPLRGSTLTQENRRTRANSGVSLPINQTVSTRNIAFYLQSLGSRFSIFLDPEIADAQLECTYYYWLPDYTSDSDEDIFTTHGRDALLWEFLKVANTHLVEEERIRIDANLAQAALDRLQDWSARAAISGTTFDLM